MTSHTLDYTDHQVVSASGCMTADGKILLASPITNPMSGPDDFSVEMALLSRRITLEASPLDGNGGSGIEGHFIVMHTPDVNQTIRGMEIKGFGQQGNLGRYVSNMPSFWFTTPTMGHSLMCDITKTRLALTLLHFDAPVPYSRSTST